MIFILGNFFLIFCVLKKAHLISVNILNEVVNSFVFFKSIMKRS